VDYEDVPEDWDDYSEDEKEAYFREREEEWLWENVEVYATEEEMEDGN